MRVKLGFVFFFAVGAAGCTSTESRCETLCGWVDNCTEDAVTCSEADIDECVDDYDTKSDDCQDAFDDFADCVDDADKVCSKVESSCLGEAAEFLEQCNGEL